MTLSKRAVFSAVLATGMVLAASADNAVLEADFSAAKTPVSKDLFGIFYEDINYAADGGLYGELVQNRSFEFQVSGGRATEKWTDKLNVNGTKSKSRLRATKESPLNANNPVYAAFTAEAAGDGFANQGYKGMPFQKGKTYPGSVFLRSKDGSVKSMTVTIGASTKNAQVSKTQITGITTEWKKYTFELTAAEDTEKGQLALYADQAGSVDVDMVSLFRADIYKNEPNGLRKDLAEMLEAMHPAFVRFPGGCIVQGHKLTDRYEWKDTIGPVEERKEEKNFWGYQQSYGIGFYEYFRLCEDLNAEPVPILNCGISWDGENNNDADVPMAKMDEYAQDALDLIEYATGPATSTWGKKRAEAGHPEPFKMNYLGIGNEDGRMHYWERYQFMAAKVHEKYPNIKLIISAGPFPSDQTFHNTWDTVKSWEKNKKTDSLVQLVDEHYYCNPAWFLTNGKRYDDLTFYPRTEGAPKVFIGEYASQVDGKHNTLYAAVTAAAYMTSIERNGDVVEISSYAPLFAKDGFTQWTPNMIWFNNSQVYGSPDYYVQQMFMTHKSDKTVKSSVTQAKLQGKKDGIGGTVGIGSWATTAQFKDVTLTNKDTGAVLYDSSKTKNLDDFNPATQTGSWVKSGPVIVQTSDATNCHMTLDNEDEMTGVSNYTFEMKAQKTGGAEGFLILFGVKGSGLYWWNMGGWANTTSCIEKGTVDGRTIIGDSKPLTLESGRWYDIKIEVSGETYRCYLDGVLQHEFTDVKNFDPLYIHVGEAAGNKVYVKIVNISTTTQDVQLKLNGASFETTGTATILTGGPDDENSFRSPKQVAPVEEAVKGVSSNFVYTVKPTSVTILELKKK